MADILPQNTPLKQCCTCKDSLPATADNFARDKTKPDGLHTKCKGCVKIYKKQYYKENKEHVMTKTRAYYQEHHEQVQEYRRQHGKQYRERPDIKEKEQQYREAHRENKRAYDREYRQENTEILKVRKKTYYEQNKDSVLEKTKLYHESHKDEMKIARRAYRQSERGRFVKRAAHQRRRAHKKSASGTYTARQLQEQKQRQKNKCYYCKAKLGPGKGDWHADHIVPLSRGGSNDISNLVIACPPCNLKKRDKLLHEWVDGGRLL